VSPECILTVAVSREIFAPVRKSPLAKGGDFFKQAEHEKFAPPPAIYSRSSSVRKSPRNCLAWEIRPYDGDLLNGGKFFTWWTKRFYHEKIAPHAANMTNIRLSYLPLEGRFFHDRSVLFTTWKNRPVQKIAIVGETHALALTKPIRFFKIGSVGKNHIYKVISDQNQNHMSKNDLKSSSKSLTSEVISKSLIWEVISNQNQNPLKKTSVVHNIIS